jgi:hypothetical protein
MKNKILLSLTMLMVLAPWSFAHALSSEIHVTKEGKANVSSAKVMQIVGNTFFARLYWGDAFIRFTIRAGSSTKFMRATGEATTIAEIKEGDILDASGELQSQTDTLTLVASSVRNSSVQKEQAVLSGNVISVDRSNRQQFLMTTKDRGVVIVNIATSTQFFKGTRTLDFDHLRAGDRVTKVTGDFDLSSKNISAQAVTIYLDTNQFKPKNFVGKLSEVPSSLDATTLKIIVDKTIYTVNLNSKTIIMRNDKSITTLQRFVAGDSVRFYGAIRETDEPIIDAEVVRNMSI